MAVVVIVVVAAAAAEVGVGAEVGIPAWDVVGLVAAAEVVAPLVDGLVRLLIRGPRCRRGS